MMQMLCISFSLLSMMFLGVAFSGCTSTPLSNSGNEQDARPIEFKKIVGLDQEVHFLTTDGRDTLIQAGGYLVKAVQDGLQLQSADDEASEAVIVQAAPITHEHLVDGPEPLAIKAEDGQQVIIVLMPKGKGFQAIGSNVVVQSRGLTGKSGKFQRKERFKPQSLKIRPFPKVTGILSTPTLGVITPGGKLYIKGKNFGESMGKVFINGKFWWGASSTLISVEEWNPTKIIVRLDKPELAYNNRDQQIRLQVKTAQGLYSQFLQMPFRAARETKWLDFNDPAVKLVYCSANGDTNLCNGHSPKGGATGCALLAGIPKWKKRTPAIYAQHGNCDLIVDIDDGSDQYAIQLKNGWVFKKFGLSQEKTSSSEKITLPTYSHLNQKVVGTSLWTPRIPWKVSPGFDRVHYAIYVQIEGPRGFSHF